MRASKWRVEEGKRRIKGTLEWVRHCVLVLHFSDSVMIQLFVDLSVNLVMDSFMFVFDFPKLTPLLDGWELSTRCPDPSWTTLALAPALGLCMNGGTAPRVQTRPYPSRRSQTRGRDRQTAPQRIRQRGETDPLSSTRTREHEREPKTDPASRLSHVAFCSHAHMQFWSRV
jgi:hypothetical protein